MQVAIICLLIMLSDNSFGHVLTTNYHLGKRADLIYRVPSKELSSQEGRKRSFFAQYILGVDPLSNNNELMHDFLSRLTPGMLVLDIGSAYGEMTRLALLKRTIVISNDNSKEKLLYNLQHISPKEKYRLYLNCQDVDTLELKDKILDRIILNNLYLMKREEVQSLLLKAHRWLRKDGRIYLMTPSSEYRVDKKVINSESSKKECKENIIDPKVYFPYALEKMPRKFHVWSIDNLKPLFEYAGFKIFHAGYFPMLVDDNKRKIDEKGAVGIIAVKACD